MIEDLKNKLYKLLRWSEKYTKTDMIYLTKGSFWVALSKSLTVVSGLILAIGFANLLPKEVFGVYQFVLSLAAIASAFTLTGMNIAIAQAVARGFEGTFRVGVLTKLKWSITIAVTSLSIALYYFINGNDTLGISMLIVGAFSPFLESFKLYSSLLIGKKEFRANAILDMWRKPIPLLVLLGTIFLTNNPVFIILAYFASHTIVVTLLYFYTVRTYKPSGTSNLEAISFGKHLSVMQIIGSIAGNIDRILLFHFLGGAALATYIFAINIPKQLQSLLTVFQPLILPKLSVRNIETIKQTLPRKALIMLLFLIGPVVLYIVSAPYIYELFFRQYTDSIIFSQIFVLTILFAPVALFEKTFAAHLKKKELYMLTAVVPTTRIALVLILVPLYGIWGILITVFVAQILSAGTIFHLFRKL